MKTRLIGVISALVGLGALSVQATEISGLGSPTSDPALTGGSVENFDGAAAGAYTSFTTSNGVTITGTNAAGGPNTFYIGSDYIGLYNNSGTNSVFNGFDTSLNQWKFTFASPVSAFGFNWGASDTDWTLNAYDSGNNLLESYDIPATFASNAGEFFGLADSGISYATLTQDANYQSYDYVFIDNFTVPGGGSSVPDGASTLMLLGGAVTALAGLARKLRS